MLDVVLTGEEDVVSYWDLPVRLWRRYNLTLVVADGVKALDTAISRPDQGREADLPGSPQTKQEGEGLAGPPPLPRRVRPHPWLSPPLLPPRPQGGPSSGQTWPSPSTPSWRVREVPLPLEDLQDRPGHSPQLQPLDLLSRSCNNITGFLISS